MLLGQCNSQLERAQQAVHFSEQWQSLFDTVQSSFDTYQKQLLEIRQEQNSFVDLDAIQVRE